MASTTCATSLGIYAASVRLSPSRNPSDLLIVVDRLEGFRFRRSGGGCHTKATSFLL